MKRARAGGKVYEYAFTMRPASTFNGPPGAIGFRASTDPRFKHGIGAWPKYLSKADIEHFDLLPLDPMDPLNVRRLYDTWVHDLHRMFAETEAVSVDDGVDKKRTLTMSTRPGVEFQVTYWNRVGSARSKRFDPTGHTDHNDFRQAAIAMLTNEERAKIRARIIPEYKP